MRVLLACLLLTSCANIGKLERIRAENPTCTVHDNFDMECPSPFLEEDLKPAISYEKLKKDEVKELSVVASFPEPKKVKQSCKMREQASMDSKPVGFIPRGTVIEVAKVSTDWYSYYDASNGRLVYLGIKCFVDGPRRKVKDGNKGKEMSTMWDVEYAHQSMQLGEYHHGGGAKGQ